MLESCEFFTVYRQLNEWEHCISIHITMNEDYNYKEIIEELAKKGIFFSGCKAAAPASIFFEGFPKNCIVTGTEDDGTIYFSKKDVLSAYWIPDFINVLTEVSDFVNK